MRKLKRTGELWIRSSAACKLNPDEARRLLETLDYLVETAELPIAGDEYYCYRPPVTGYYMHRVVGTTLLLLYRRVPGDREVILHALHRTHFGAN